MRRTPNPIEPGRVVMWLFRALWVVLPLTAGPLFDAALRHTSRAVQLVCSIGLWSAWTAVLAASLIPTLATLTLVRVIAPSSLVAAIVAATRETSASAAAVGVVACALASVVSLVAEFGERFVQASAYGDERRFPLRPPGLLMVTIVPLGWALAVAVTASGPLLIAAHRAVAGIAITAVALAWDAIFVRAVHQLSRRFAVFVPAGFVIHDHVVLADTALFRATTIDGFALAPPSSAAASATGAALGLAVELRLREMATIVLAGTRTKPQGTALHVRSVLFSPSRPGRLLAAAAARGWTQSHER